ncbi:btk-binding protein-related [Anaeramoeba flamelloides]|uniref:Btk-binding protein-related n=1 Tax=Anaeramoeba flamelloides TaxID=1746091 RepID=A0AAV7YQX3_9EUKA|nr:btk-binding protein-related [Anaeramoeba flamelloides]
MGDVLVYGENLSGSLGLPITETQNEIVSSKEFDQEYLQMSTNLDQDTVGITREGKIFHRKHAEKEICFYDLQNKFVDIKCGRHHFLALTISGKVYSWVSNKKYGSSYGQTAHSEAKFEPTLIQFFEDKPPAKMIGCGYEQSLVLLSDGSLYIFGFGGFQINVGLLGFGDMENKLVPTKLAECVKKIYTGFGMHFFYLNESNQLFGWGNDRHHQLSLKTQNSTGQLTPKQVKTSEFKISEIKKITISYCATYVLTLNGQLFSVGTKLENGMEEDASYFKRIPFFKKKKSKVLDLVSGSYWTIVMVMDHNVDKETFYLSGTIEFETQSGEKNQTWLNTGITLKNTDRLVNLCSGYFLSIFLIVQPNVLAYDFLVLFERGENTDYLLLNEIKIHREWFEWRIKCSLETIEDKLSQFQTSAVIDWCKWVYCGKSPWKEQEKENIDLICKAINFVDWKKSSLQLDLLNWYENDKSKDFQIITKNKNKETILPVHKLILQARSQLFRAMFISIEESPNSITDLTAKPANIISKVIKFLYTGNLNSKLKKKNLLQVYELFDYYQINSKNK